MMILKPFGPASQQLIRLPIGSWPGKATAARRALTIITRWPSARSSVVEVAALHDRHAHRVEEAGRDHAQRAVDEVGRDRLSPFGHETVGAAAAAHRRIGRDRGRRDARHRGRRLVDPPQRLDDVRRLGEAGGRQRDARAEDAARIEAGVRALQRDGAADQEAGADEQQQRQRDLGDDERRRAGDRGVRRSIRVRRRAIRSARRGATRAAPAPGRTTRC